MNAQHEIMKQWRLRLVRHTRTVAAGAMLVCASIFAADEPAGAPPPPLQQQDGPRGDRVRREAGQERRPAFNAGRGGFGGLNLDEKQNELLRSAMQAENDELRKLYEKLQIAQKELVKAVIDEKFDEGSVRQKAEAVGKIQSDITVLRAKAFAAVAPTLKPEQRDQIENNRAASAIITGAGAAFGPGGFVGGPPDAMQDRAGRRGDRGNLPPGNEPNRRRGDRFGGAGQ